MLKEARSTPQPKFNFLVLRTFSKLRPRCFQDLRRTRVRQTAKGTHSLESTWEETASAPGACVRGRINQLPLHSCTSQFQAPRPFIMGIPTWLVPLCQQLQEEQLKFSFRSPLKKIGQYLDSLHSWDISANLEPRNLSPIWLLHIFYFLSRVLQKWPGSHLITSFRILHGNSRKKYV